MGRRLSFAEINAAADELKRTHYERQASITQEHFLRHPECRKVILRMDDEANVIRGKSDINITARLQRGWFTNKMWSQHPDDVRPVESRNSTPESGIPYRVIVTSSGDVPDRDFGLVDLPAWLKKRYIPALQAGKTL